ncbi:MAG: Uma2 family endonuclease [Saprospiraceae bacterium]|nr:Uma2 family endonuclease [Saprospiraceae bacterium]
MVAILKDIKSIRKPKAYTFEAYLRREEKAIEKHEFYQGKIVKMPGGTDIHSEIAGNMIATLKNAVRPLPKKFKVYTSDLKIRIESLDSGVYPDALVICVEPEYWQGRRDVIVNPLLVVEVLSPSTEGYDRLGKFELYKELPSFQEYVLINTDKYSVETRFREEPDLWRIRTETNKDNPIALRSLGVSISMTDIYENIVFPLKK